jgi:Animal haem peroxidase
MRALKTRFLILGALVVAGVAAKRARDRAAAESSYRNSLPWWIYNSVSARIDRKRGWDKVSTPLGLAVLVGVRNILRQRNLHDTNEAPTTGAAPAPPFDATLLTQRSPDGTYNDLAIPTMGRAGSRFGRNVPHEYTYPDADRLFEPNPREVSLRLLTRAPFQPATSVNALAAAWLQFMIRDWFSHGRGDPANTWTINLEPGDPWPEQPMRIPRTPADPTRPAGDDGFPPTYVNSETHWWDASQLYGNSLQQQQLFRAGAPDGKLRLRDDGLLDLPTDPSLDPTQVPGWWLGLALMATIFVREHNAICDRLRSEYPQWSDEDVFQRARLVNAALIAKIHTVEWTPAVISHPTTKLALRANWWGLAGERISKVLGRVSSDEVLSGIPGSHTNHYGVPYSLTEEFVAVYRMHPLVPDDYSLRRAADDGLIREATFPELAGPKSKQVTEQIPMTDLLYSFGTINPGLVVLHNFPKFLQEFERPDGKFQDLAATDILRSRELGVPRYNDFRRLLNLKPAASFDDLTDNPQWAREIEEVYGGDIEQVDLTVGMFAEPLPENFAFSDTAFRIFVLMASRRLNSDRFFTTDYNAQVYTQAGLDWIDENDMKTVLLRHYPGLAPAMRGVANAFWPWHKAAA